MASGPLFALRALAQPVAAYEIRKCQQILWAVLALEHLAPFGDGVEASQVQHGGQHLADAKALVHEAFTPGAELIGLDHVAGVEAIGGRARDDALRVDEHRVLNKGLFLGATADAQLLGLSGLSATPS